MARSTPAPNYQAERIGIPVSDAALIGGPSRAQCFRLIAKGKLASYKIGRVRMVRMDSLRALIAEAEAT